MQKNSQLISLEICKIQRYTACIVSEMQHPEISIDAVTFFSPEEEFAKLAQEVLGRYGVMCADIQRGLSYPVTDRIEIADDDEPNERALRLRRTQVLALSNTVNVSPALYSDAWAATDSEDYVVIELQHGSVDKQDIDPQEPLVDEDYEWKPYVMAVLQTDEPYEINILDANTGKELAVQDVMRATDALRHLGNSLYAAILEDGIGSDQSIAFRSLPPSTERVLGFDEFDSAEVDLNYSCAECGEDNGVCDHNTPKLN